MARPITIDPTERMNTEGALIVSRAITALDKVGKMANPHKFDLNEGNVSQIENAINEKVDEVLEALRKALAGEKVVKEAKPIFEFK
jgi:hypothetical protein